MVVFFFFLAAAFSFFRGRMGRRGGWDAQVSANGVDRGEIFTRVKASTRGRELSRHGAKLILPAAQGGGEGCAHA